MKTLKRFAAGVAVVMAVMAPGVAMADGLTLPPPDPSLVFVAPTPDQPNYDARIDAFIQATVPDTYAGEPVEFLQTFTDNGGVDVLGVPTSGPKADPNNPNFVYQRFQNGVLFYNGSDGTTVVLPVG